MGIAQKYNTQVYGHNGLAPISENTVYQNINDTIL